MVTPNPEPVVTEPAASPPAAETPKTFTQDEVNAMMGKTRQESKAQFADYDALKARAALADELEAAKMSATEKLEARAVKAERDAIDARASVTDTAIRSEIRMQAAQLGVVDVDAAYQLVERNGISYNEEAGVVGVDEALTQLLESKPWLKGSKALAPNLNAGGGAAAGSGPKLSDAEKQMAHRLFSRLPAAEAEAEYAAGKR